MKEVKNCYKAGVSAVIGVILMVAIVVAIAATVVVWVTEIYNQQPVDDTSNYDGWVVYGKNTSVMLTNFGLYEKWSIALSNVEQGNATTNHSYLFEIYPVTVNNTVTYYNDVTPPQVGQHVSILCKRNDDGWLIVKEVKVI